MKTIFRAALVVALAIVMLAGPVAADAVYHTERLSLQGGTDSNFHGQVVNIHANGPVVGALERYQVVNAEPDSSYQVWIQLCGAAGFGDFINTAVLETDRNGNGHARARFSADDLKPFSGAVVSIRWSLKDVRGTDVYTTECTVVAID